MVVIMMVNGKRIREWEEVIYMMEMENRNIQEIG